MATSISIREVRKNAYRNSSLSTPTFYRLARVEHGRVTFVSSTAHRSMTNALQTLICFVEAKRKRSCEGAYPRVLDSETISVGYQRGDITMPCRFIRVLETEAPCFGCEPHVAQYGLLLEDLED